MKRRRTDKGSVIYEFDLSEEQKNQINQKFAQEDRDNRNNIQNHKWITLEPIWTATRSELAKMKKEQKLNEKVLSRRNANKMD